MKNENENVTDEVETDGVQAEADTEDTDKKSGPIIKDQLGMVTIGEKETPDEAYVRVVSTLQDCIDYNEKIVMHTNQMGDTVAEDARIYVTASRNKGEKHYSLVGIWVLPTMEALETARKGYTEDTVTDAMVSRLVDNSRRFYKSDEEGEPELPFTAKDFVTKAAGGITAIYDPAFNAMFKTFEKVLKARAKAFTFTKSELHNALSNKAYADYHYGAVESSQLFDKIIAQAVSRITQGIDAPTEEKPAIRHNDVAVSADWFKSIATERVKGVYNVEEIIEPDEDFGF